MQIFGWLKKEKNKKHSLYNYSKLLRIQREVDKISSYQKSSKNALKVKINTNTDVLMKNIFFRDTKYASYIFFNREIILYFIKLTA